MPRAVFLRPTKADRSDPLASAGSTVRPSPAADRPEAGVRGYGPAQSRQPALRAVPLETVRRPAVPARCTVERLMRSLGISGMVRGKKIITTQPDTSQQCPDDKVNRLLKADRPNKLWGEPLCTIGSSPMASDFTYVPTWSGVRHCARTNGAFNGLLYVAFVIDVFARRIVGWRASTEPLRLYRRPISPCYATISSVFTFA